MEHNAAEALYVTLMAIAPVFALVGAALFIWRRNVFPLCGRVTTFVLLWEFVLLRAAMDTLYFAMEGDELACWVLLVKAHTDFFAQNAMLARIFRLWYLVYAGRERLDEITRIRARKVSNPSKMSAGRAGSPRIRGYDKPGSPLYVSQEAAELGPMAVSLEHQRCQTAGCTSKHEVPEQCCTFDKKSGDQQENPTTSSSEKPGDVKIPVSNGTASTTKAPTTMAQKLKDGNKSLKPTTSRSNLSASAKSSQLGQLYPSTNQCEIKSSRWFLRRPYFGKTSFLWKVVVAVSLLDVLAVNLIFLLMWLSDRSSGFCGGFQIVESFLFAQYFLTILCVFFFGYKIRNVRDGFFIKDEFKVAGPAALGIGIILAVNISGVSPDTLGARAVVFWVLSMLSIYQVTYYPVLKSFGYSFPSTITKSVSWWWANHKDKQKNRLRARRLRAKSRSKPPSLRQVLTDEKFKETRSSFEAQMAREFAIENLQFHEVATVFLELAKIGQDLEDPQPPVFEKSKAANTTKAKEKRGSTSTAGVSPNVLNPVQSVLVMDLTDLAEGEGALLPLTDGDVTVHALELYREFVADSSPSEINIPFTQKQDIQNALKQHIANFDHLAANELKHPTLILDESMIELNPDSPRVPADVFERARKTVFHLMENDPFQRFLTAHRKSLSEQKKKRSISSKFHARHSGKRGSASASTVDREKTFSQTHTTGLNTLTSVQEVSSVPTEGSRNPIAPFAGATFPSADGEEKADAGGVEKSKSGAGSRSDTEGESESEDGTSSVAEVPTVQSPPPAVELVEIAIEPRMFSV